MHAAHLLSRGKDALAVSPPPAVDCRETNEQDKEVEIEVKPDITTIKMEKI